MKILKPKSLLLSLLAFLNLRKKLTALCLMVLILFAVFIAGCEKEDTTLKETDIPAVKETEQTSIKEIYDLPAHLKGKSEEEIINELNKLSEEENLKLLLKDEAGAAQRSLLCSPTHSRSYFSLGNNTNEAVLWCTVILVDFDYLPIVECLGCGDGCAIFNGYPAFYSCGDNWFWGTFWCFTGEPCTPKCRTQGTGNVSTAALQNISEFMANELSHTGIDVQKLYINNYTEINMIFSSGQPEYTEVQKALNDFLEVNLELIEQGFSSESSLKVESRHLAAADYLLAELAKSVKSAELKASILRIKNALFVMEGKDVKGALKAFDRSNLDIAK